MAAIQEVIKELQDKHFGEWLRARSEVAEEISNRQTMFCLCGRLATGLHESGCRKLQTRITTETAKRLKHLLIK